MVFQTATIVQARAVCGSLMKTALVDGIIETNPVTAVKRPRTATTTEKYIPAPTRSRRFSMRPGTPSGRCRCWLRLRPGRVEVKSLHCVGVILRLTQTSFGSFVESTGIETQTAGRSYEFLDPKTQRSFRTIGLPDSVLVRLRGHRKAQLEYRFAHGTALVDLDLVFDNGDGSPLDPEGMTRAFKKLAAQAGCPKARLHDLRHAAATSMARGGVHPKAVSSALGHSSVAFTLGVYTSDWDEGGKQAANAIGDALGL